VIPKDERGRLVEKVERMARAPIVMALAGPNGAGKTTSASRLLREALAVDEFVNADTIAAGLSAYRPEASAVAAGRVMFDRLRHVAQRRMDFAFETTLSGRGRARWLQELRSVGYRMHFLFLSLPSPDLAVARVEDRVRRGGHHVSDDVVRRRFGAGIRNLFESCLPVVDSGQIYDNSQAAGARLIASWAPGKKPAIADSEAWDRLREQAR
jgi:predicted ABC-type ATPase